MSDIKIDRPMPPESLFNYDPAHTFEPSLELAGWVRQHILEESGKLFNPDHVHLLDANIGYLWAGMPNERKGQRVIGMAEELTFRCGRWQKYRQEMQFAQWFDTPLPDYIITLDAAFCENCSDIDFCALVEHELYHIRQQLDAFGVPKFSKSTGRPMLELRGHDVEEFVGVVRRYGAGSPDGKLEELVQAANSKPEVSKANISAACGTCQMRLAS